MERQMGKPFSVQGELCWLVENMGFNHSIGMYAKMVKLKDGSETVVVRPTGGTWRFWTPRDRTQPLREAAAKGWPHDDLQKS
jgi:hypothetical protein